MYTAVLMLAMTSGAETVEFGRRGCNGCTGSYAACSGRHVSGCSGYSTSCCGGGYRTGYSYYNGTGNTYSNGVVVQGPGGAVRQSYYSGPSVNGAVVRVMVPDPEAEIWFDGAPTTQRGADRMFHSPPLDGNGRYSYTIRARWMQNGRAVEQERRVEVQQGQPVMVDFRVNSGETVTPPKPAPKVKLPKSSQQDQSN